MPQITALSAWRRKCRYFNRLFPQKGAIKPLNRFRRFQTSAAKGRTARGGGTSFHSTRRLQFYCEECRYAALNATKNRSILCTAA